MRAVKFSDEHFLEAFEVHRDGGQVAEKVAEALGASVAAVRKRIAKLEAPVVPRVVRDVESDIFNVRQVLKDNYQRCVDLLAEDGVSAAERIRAIAEIRQHGQTAMAMLETLYSIEEVHEFQKVVLGVLGEVDETTRQRVLDKLQQRRAVRAVFIAGGN